MTEEQPKAPSWIEEEYKKALFGSALRPEVIKILLGETDKKASVKDLAKGLGTQQNAVISSINALVATQMIRYALDSAEKERVLVLNPADQEIAKGLVSLLEKIHRRVIELSREMPVSF